MVPLTSAPTDPLGDFLLPTPTTLGSAGFVSGPQTGHSLAREYSKGPSELQATTATWALGMPCVQGPMGKKRSQRLRGYTRPWSARDRAAFPQWRQRGLDRELGWPMGTPHAACYSTTHYHCERAHAAHWLEKRRPLTEEGVGHATRSHEDLQRSQRSRSGI